MQKEEIIAGLKTAIEHGESLEKAKQTFINAGYNPREIEEAAASMGGFLTSFPSQSAPQKLNSFQQKSSYSNQIKQAMQEKEPEFNLPVPKPSSQSQQTSKTNQFQNSPQTNQNIQQQYQPEKKTGKKLIIIIIFILLILLSFLVISIFLKEPILDFIKNL